MIVSRLTNRIQLSSMAAQLHRLEQHMSGQVCTTSLSNLFYSAKNSFTKNFQDMLECDVPLGSLTWFRTGGTADLQCHLYETK